MKQFYFLLTLCITSYLLPAQNVGINTTTPTEKLDIRNGQIRLARTASYDNSILFSMPQAQLAGEHEGLKFQILGVDKAFIGYTSTGTSGNFLRLSGASSNSNDLTISAAGNVGIGLNTPSEKLEVAGNIAMQGAGTTLQLKNGAIDKGFVQLSGDNLRLGTNSGNDLGKVVLRSNGYDQVVLDATGTTTLLELHALGVQRGTISASSTTGNISISTIGTNDLVNLNNELYVNQTQNRVGIGTSSPAERLDVLGNMKILGDIKLGGKLQSTTQGNNNMLPLAWAKFNKDGVRVAGTSNITAGKVTNTNEPGTNWFQVSVDGEDISNACSIITPGWISCSASTMVSGSGIKVYLYNPETIDGLHLPFSIVIYK